jgi:Skp family chaperone for outer membrane proteins
MFHLYKELIMYKKVLPLLALGSVGLFIFTETDKTIAVEPISVKTTEFNYYSDTLFVNMQDAMLASLQGKQAQKVVETEEMKYAELAQKDQQRLMQLKNELETQGSMLSADARRKVEKEFADLQRDYQNKVQDWRSELQYTMQRETDAMVKDIEQAAKVLAENANKAVVVDAPTGRILYLREDRSSTNDLVALLDNQYTMKLAQKDHGKQSAVVASKETKSKAITAA